MPNSVTSLKSTAMYLRKSLTRFLQITSQRMEDCYSYVSLNLAAFQFNSFFEVLVLERGSSIMSWVVVTTVELVATAIETAASVATAALGLPYFLRHSSWKSYNWVILWTSWLPLGVLEAPAVLVTDIGQQVVGGVVVEETLCTSLFIYKSDIVASIIFQ